MGRAGCQRGYTLIELVLVMALGLIVVGGPLMFVVLSLGQQNAASSRAVAATQGQVGLERLTRDLRQVAPNTSAAFTWSGAGASVTLTEPIPGSGGTSTQQVTWSCSFGDAGTCTRQVGTGAVVAEIRNVESLSFSPLDAGGNRLGGSSAPYSATSPAYVGITLKVLDVSQLDGSAQPSHHVPGVRNYITVQDGVDLLNNSL